MYNRWDHSTTKRITYTNPKMGQDLSNFTQQKRKRNKRRFPSFSGGTFIVWQKS
jgi:hypothetical protein